MDFFSPFCLSVKNPEPKDQISKMIKILSGEMAIELHLQFLIRNNNTDLMILKNTKVRDFVECKIIVLDLSDSSCVCFDHVLLFLMIGCY